MLGTLDGKVKLQINRDKELMKMILPQHEFARWILDNKRGLLAVFGGFLIQLCAGDRYYFSIKSNSFGSRKAAEITI